MKVRTPKFIIEECERLIGSIKPEYKAAAEKLREELQEYIKVEDAIRIVDSMRKLSLTQTNYVMVPELFRRSHISQSLINELESYENQDEAKKMLETVKDIATCNSSWCQDDSDYRWTWDRTFWLVKHQKEWKRICARATVLPTRGSIKIAFEVREPKMTTVAKNAYQELSANDYWRMKELSYKIWFRLFKRVHYYVYVP